MEERVVSYPRVVFRIRKSRCGIRPDKAQNERDLQTQSRREHVLWQRNGPVGMTRTDTLTTSAAFVNPRKQVQNKETRPATINYRPQAENRGARAGPAAETVRSRRSARVPSHRCSTRFAAAGGYANFYICNASDIVPTLNDPNDRVRWVRWASYSRTGPWSASRVGLVLGSAPHCLTQQQPAA